jgi:hypothetical protein
LPTIVPAQLQALSFVAAYLPTGHWQPIENAGIDNGHIQLDVTAPGVVQVFAVSTQRLGQVIRRVLRKTRSARPSRSCVSNRHPELVAVSRPSRHRGGLDPHLCFGNDPDENGYVRLGLSSRSGTASRIELTSRGALWHMTSPIVGKDVLHAERAGMRNAYTSPYLVPPGGTLSVGAAINSDIEISNDASAALGQSLVLLLSRLRNAGDFQAQTMFACTELEDSYQVSHQLHYAATCAREHIRGPLQRPLAEALDSRSLAASLRSAYPQRVPAYYFTVLRRSDVEAGVPTFGLLKPPIAGTGYGEIKPSEVNNDGDGQSFINSIYWSSWGGAVAVGWGRASWVPPRAQCSCDGIIQPAEIIATDLGTCEGRVVYRRYEWFFPEHRDYFRPHDLQSTCSRYL